MQAVGFPQVEVPFLVPTGNAVHIETSFGKGCIDFIAHFERLQRDAVADASNDIPRLDNLFINFDTGNLILYGYGNPVDAAYTFGKYVRNMHAKDALPPRDPRKLGKEVEIGTGFVDFAKVFRLLTEVGYDRYVIIEREIGSGDQAASIAKAMGYLKEIVGKNSE